MASPQPRKRARTTRASRRASAFELLGDGTARTALPVDDARKSTVLANASGEFRCGGQNQASLEAIKRFLAACDEDGEVSSSPLSRADADVALRCCEAGATLELPALTKLGVARLRLVRGATSPPTGRRRLARNIQESDNSRLIDTRVSASSLNLNLTSSRRWRGKWTRTWRATRRGAARSRWRVQRVVGQTRTKTRKKTTQGERADLRN